MRQRILNTRSQPVEIHTAGGVIVLPALGEIEMDLDTEGELQLQHLEDTRRLRILPAEEASEVDAAPRGAKKAAAKKR